MMIMMGVPKMVSTCYVSTETGKYLYTPVCFSRRHQEVPPSISAKVSNFPPTNTISKIFYHLKHPQLIVLFSV